MKKDPALLWAGLALIGTAVVLHALSPLGPRDLPPSRPGTYSGETQQYDDGRIWTWNGTSWHQTKGPGWP